MRTIKTRQTSDFSFFFFFICSQRPLFLYFYGMRSLGFKGFGSEKQGTIYASFRSYFIHSFQIFIYIHISFYSESTIGPQGKIAWGGKLLEQEINRAQKLKLDAMAFYLNCCRALSKERQMGKKRTQNRLHQTASCTNTATEPPGEDVEQEKQRIGRGNHNLYARSGVLMMSKVP